MPPATSRPEPRAGAPTPFDAQAAEFDRRVSLAEADCRAIAAAVLRLAGVRAGDLIVEIGAGTGMIGCCFPQHPVRYVGLDLSRGMLEVFRRRAGAAGFGLSQADGAAPWPFSAGSAQAIFSSRAIHLLPLEHVMEEIFRVGAAGAVCVLGWVERRPESVKARMSREMQRRLRERGFSPRSAGSRRVLDAAGKRGAELVEKVVVARWPVEHSPRRSLADWQSKPGLGGIVLPPGVQGEVLRELEVWAIEVFGGVDVSSPSEESYVLEGFRLPMRKGTT